MMTRLLLLFFLLLLSFSSANAQSAGEDTLSYRLPGLTVTATRTSIAPEKAPARVTVLDSTDLQQSGAQSVGELLERRSGAFVKRNGSTGLASISLRGSGSSQSLVLLDGHRIENPQLGQLDLSLLPSLLVESVEIMHGSGSALYGSHPFGGVVNVRTLNQGRTETIRAETVYGAFGERGASLFAAGSQGNFTAAAAGEMKRTSGDFPYTNEALLPPCTVRREGADRRQLSLFSALGYRTDGSEFQLNGWYNEAERGLPGVSTTDPRSERQWDEQLRIWGDARFQQPWGTLELNALAQDLHLRYHNPEESIDQTGRAFSASTEAVASSMIGPHWMISGGLSFRHRQADHPKLSSRTDEQIAAAFLSGMGRYGRLRLYPMLRTDSYFTAGSGSPMVAATPQLGANLQPLARYNLRIKSSVGRSFRMPTLNDRYWVPGGNPDLQPEHGWSVDAGIALPWTHHQFELTAYTSWIGDQITWKSTGAGHWSPFNVTRMRSRGIEASYRMRQSLSTAFTVHGSLFYTWTNASERSDRSAGIYKHQVRYVPRHQLKTTLGFTWNDIYLGTNLRGVSRRFVTADGRQSIPPYLVVDATAQTALNFASLTARLGLSVDNLLDEDYSIVQYYPMPPRHGRIRLTLQWNKP